MRLWIQSRFDEVRTDECSGACSIFLRTVLFVRIAMIGDAPDHKEWDIRALARFGYASRHLLLTVPDPAPPTYGDLVGHRGSVQVRTVLQHAWAEFEQRSAESRVARSPGIRGDGR